MSRKELIARIRKNKNNKWEAIRLISDFLMISRNEAEKIYREEFES
jgi:hypothetical protein